MGRFKDAKLLKEALGGKFEWLFLDTIDVF